MIEPRTRLCPNDEEIAARVIDGEAIIINLATGSYYSMTDVGGLIWASIEQHRSVEEIAAEVSAAYDVSLERARADLLDLSAELVRCGVVLLSPEPAARGESPIPPSPRLPYATPALTAYDDMRNLLALDPPTPLLSRTPGSDDPNSR
jgi:hypothetical protein